MRTPSEGAAFDLAIEHHRVIGLDEMTSPDRLVCNMLRSDDTQSIDLRRRAPQFSFKCLRIQAQRRTTLLRWSALRPCCDSGSFRSSCATAPPTSIRRID
jgi:hypothetical protein